MKMPKIHSKKTRLKVGKENNDMTLILPYTVADLKYYEEYYDSIVIPESVYGAHPKSAITLKNRWMIEQADIVIAYITHTYGGAYATYRYAMQKKKEVFNLGSFEDSNA